MARTLNSSGIATNIVTAIATDDNGLIGVWGSKQPTLTLNGAWTAPASRNTTWNGHSVPGLYAVTNYPPGAFAYLLSGASDIWTNAGTVILMVANYNASANLTDRAILSTSTGDGMGVDGSSKFYWQALTGGIGTTSLTHGMSCLVAWEWDNSVGSSGEVWFGQAGGSVAQEKSGLTISSNPGSRTCPNIGANYDGAIAIGSDIVALLSFDKKLSESELNGLLADPMGTIFSSAVTGGGASAYYSRRRR